MSFYVADVFGYVMTGPPLYRLANLTKLMPYSTLEDTDRQGEDRS